MDRISRGWALFQQSWAVLKQDRSLVVFPILSTLSAIVAVIAIGIAALFFDAAHSGTGSDSAVVYYAAGILAVYVSTFIAIFFNVALAACAERSLDGEDTTVGDGISVALRRIGPILGWALVATTVGLILRTLGHRTSQLGRLVTSLVGAGWAVATFFVIPVLALEDSGPLESLRRSVEVVKARWGESATGAATIWIITFAGMCMVGACGAMAGTALSNAGLTALAATVGGLTVAGVIMIAMASAAVNQIFRVALYRYALDGQVTPGFDLPSMQTALCRR